MPRILSNRGGGVSPSMHWGRHPTPTLTATAVDGTHPTGMLSCYLTLLVLRPVSCVKTSIFGDVAARYVFSILFPLAGMCNTEEAMAAAILLQMSSQGGNSGEKK